MYHEAYYIDIPYVLILVILAKFLFKYKPYFTYLTLSNLFPVQTQVSHRSSSLCTELPPHAVQYMRLEE